MKARLGINTGFAINRYPSPSEWIPLVAETFGLKLVQFTADLLNPSLPSDIIRSQIKAINELKKEHGIEIKHTFTSSFTRVNHLAHPDEQTRKYWAEWFCRFADISVELGAESMGSHFGIFSVNDLKDPKVMKERFSQVVDGWHRIASYAKKAGLKYLAWEPMSIPREMGETTAEAKRIHKAVNDGSALSFKLCLDVDHGDVASKDPKDTDPYAWIKEMGKETAMFHMKQPLKDKRGHYPFTPENNAQGKITPEKFLSALQDAGIGDIDLLLELSFREREPFESNMIRDIKTSVEYWRPHVSI